MSTILLTWNPAVWTISDDDWRSWIDEIDRTGVSRGNWSTGRNKSVQPGDRCYLVKQGKGSRGIVASGWATSDVYQDERNEGAGDFENAVDVDFDAVVWRDDPLSIAVLLEKVPEVKWRYLMQSGTAAKPEAAEKIGRLWVDRLGQRSAPPEPKVPTPPGRGRRSPVAAGAKVQKVIEDYAQDLVFRHYEQLGWLVTDHRVGNPYDGIATKGTQKIFIESKGTRGSGLKINMTFREVEFATENASKYVLGVVSGIKINKNGTVKKNSGTLRIIEWKPEADALKPRSFYLSIPAE